MESIFFEKQEGNLCAQHCLNALLQGQFFSVLDLADIARKLDHNELSLDQNRAQLAEFWQSQKSQNMDDSGFFSVQVIAEALKVFGFELIPFQSSDPTAVHARQDPTIETAYVCNMQEHWFTIRRLGYQFFNLNSMLPGPELISDGYLHLFLTQLANDGYSIFIVRGDFPDCTADQNLRLSPAISKPTKSTSVPRGRHLGDIPNSFPGTTPTPTPNLSDHDLAAAFGAHRSAQLDDTEPELRRIIEQSRREVDFDDPSLMEALKASAAAAEDDEFQAALLASLSESEANVNGDVAGPSERRPPSSQPIAIPANAASAATQRKAEETDKEAIRLRRLEFFEKQQEAKAKNEDAAKQGTSKPT